MDQKIAGQKALAEEKKEEVKRSEALERYQDKTAPWAKTGMVRTTGQCSAAVGVNVVTSLARQSSGWCEPDANGDSDEKGRVTIASQQNVYRSKLMAARWIGPSRVLV